MSLIAKIQELTTLSKEANDWLALHIESFEFSKNQIVLQSGATCHYLYYVKKGSLGAYYPIEDHEVCNWISIEGDFATSYYSFINQTKTYETIACFESCETEAIHYRHVQGMFSLFPETERAGRLMLEEYYSRLEERLLSIQFKSAKERYQQLIENRPDVLLKAPLGRIASYLGMKQETLSRIRSER